MEIWESLMEYSVVTRVVTAGFIIGALLGIVMHRSNFCTMGALSDINAFGDWRRFRTWLLAMAVAILASQTLHYLGIVDLGTSIYTSTSLNWLALGVGGLIFGIGMVFGSGCGARNLIRVGGGDLKALIVVFIIAITGYMTLRGLFAPLRIALNDLATIDLAALGMKSASLGAALAATDVVGAETSPILAGLGAALALLIYCFSDGSFRSSPRHILTGSLIGLLVTAGWWATGVLGFDDFEPAPLFSLTFISPTANTLQYLMTFTGATIGFGIATVLGMIAGSFVSAITQRRFAIAGFADKNDLIRHLLGGMFMGTGAVISLGCTVGQGISGISTLAIGSVVALLAIIAGGFIGFKAMERGFLV